jgi:hypothetical protein
VLPFSASPLSVHEIPHRLVQLRNCIQSVVIRALWSKHASHRRNQAKWIYYVRHADASQAQGNSIFSDYWYRKLIGDLLHRGHRALAEQDESAISASLVGSGLIDRRSDEIATA